VAARRRDALDDQLWNRTRIPRSVESCLGVKVTSNERVCVGVRVMVKRRASDQSRQCARSGDAEVAKVFLVVQ
jgi:hypothetical protein